MFAPQLLTPVHFAAARTLLLPRFAGQAAAAVAALPNDFFLLPGIGPQAEAIVLQRLGNDWPLFTNPATVLPSSYAQGNSPSAHALCDDALVQFLCARSVATGLLAQTIASSLKSADQAETFGVDWKGLETCFWDAGCSALNLLRRTISVRGRRYDNPTSGASGGMDHAIRMPVAGMVVRDDWDWDRERW